jgi:hypothetical protein
LDDVHLTQKKIRQTLDDNRKCVLLITTRLDPPLPKDLKRLLWEMSSRSLLDALRVMKGKEEEILSQVILDDST